jgi:hypothetical protein
MQISKGVARVVVLGLTLVAPAAAGEGSAPLPVRAWKVGDNWTVCVELYSRDWMKAFGRPPTSKAGTKPQVVARYLVRVKVAGTETVGAIPCFLLDFLPGRGAPEGARESCRLFVRQQDGWAVKVLQGSADRSPLWLEQLGEASLLASFPEGQPIELFPSDRPCSIKPAGSSLALDIRQQQTGNNQRFVESILKSGDREQLRIQQMWDQDGKWWTEYERYVKGHKDLRAHLVLDDTPNQPTAMPPPIRAPVRVEGPPMTPQNDPTGLHSDPRLQARVTFDLKNPLVDDVLDELRKATGVVFFRADEVQNQYPVAASLGFHSTPACRVMDALAASRRVEGRWQKEDAGYRIVPNGNPVDIPEAAEPKAPPSSSSWTLFIILATALIACLSLGYWWGRRSRRPAAASP